MYKPLFQQISRGLLVLFILMMGYFLTVLTFEYIFPFLIAVLLAMMLHPFVHFLERLKIPRAIGTITVIIIIFIFIFGFLFLIITEIIQGTAFLAERIPTFFEKTVTTIDQWVADKLIPFYQSVSSYFHTLNESQQVAIQEYFQKLLNDIATNGAFLLQEFFLNFPNYIAVIPNSLSFIIFTILATFFITKDWNSIYYLLKKYSPLRLQLNVKDFFSHLKKAVSGYVKAQFLLVSISTVIILIGLLILQVQHALTITLLTVVFDILPFIGTGVIFVPWIIYCFFTGNYSMTIELTILYMFVILSRQLLEPKIISSSIGINPLVGLITIFVSFKFWGVLGILLAPIFIILLHVLLESGIMKQVWQFIRG